MSREQLPGLYRLLEELGWHLQGLEQIEGGYAANLYRVYATCANGEAVRAVYKRFVHGRDAELPLYHKIASELPYGLPQLYGSVVEADERGILIEESGVALKPIFQKQSRGEQEETLDGLVRMFAELHVTFAQRAEDWLQEGLLSPYPFDSSESWAQDAWKRLAFLVEAGIGDVTFTTLQEVRDMIDFFYPRYPKYVAGRHTFTHGDPHMENILLDGERVRLIDWEYASLALPQRDLTILLQDVLDEELHTYALGKYRRELERRGWAVDEQVFERGFRACMFDNTLMMLGWEIYKYQEGNLSRADLEEIVSVKLSWIRRYFDKETPDLI